MVDMITCSFRRKYTASASSCVTGTEMIASDSGGTQMRRPICPSRAGFSHRAHPWHDDRGTGGFWSWRNTPLRSNWAVSPSAIQIVRICGVETPLLEAQRIEDRNAPPCARAVRYHPAAQKVSSPANRTFAIMSVLHQRVPSRPRWCHAAIFRLFFDIFVEEVVALCHDGESSQPSPLTEIRPTSTQAIAFVERHHVTMISNSFRICWQKMKPPVCHSVLCGCLSAAAMCCGAFMWSPAEQAEVYNTLWPLRDNLCASYYCCNSGTLLEDGNFIPSVILYWGAQIRFWISLATRVAKGQTGEICICRRRCISGLATLATMPRGNSAERQPDGSTAYAAAIWAISCRMATLHSAPQGTTRSKIYGAGGTCWGGVQALSVQGCSRLCPGFTDEDGLSYDRLCGAFRQ